MEKPSILYRGISVSAEKFQELEIHDDIVPIAPPQKNEEGKDIVSDGNEYGIYMTTNHLMAKNVYGNTHMTGSAYSQECLFVDRYNRQQRLFYPQIGVVYEIDTKNLMIKKPWISKQLEGHYNNGFQGDEWITTTSESHPNHIIPKSSYHITDVVVGNDILNDQVVIDISGLSDQQIKSQVVEIIERRKTGYDLFLEQVHTYPPEQRRKLETKMPIYKKLFNAQDGIALYDYSKCDPSNVHDMISYLMQQTYLRDPQNIDLESLELLGKIAAQTKSVEELPESIQFFINGFNDKINNPDIHERVKELSKTMIAKLKTISQDLGKKMDEAQPQIAF